MKFSILLAISALLHLASTAQYYPAPEPVDPRRESGLLSQLKYAKPDAGRARIQVQLCNLYFNKPFKKRSDLQKALSYAREASDRSLTLHDSAVYTDAMLCIADILTEWNDMTAAENILSRVNDTARIDLLLTLSYKYRVRDGNTKAMDLEKALELARQAKGISIRMHQPEKEILALQDIAAVHMDQHKKDAERELLDVLRQYRAIGYSRLHYTYNLLTDFYKGTGNNDKALYYSFETIKSMRTTGDTLAAGDFYTWQAAICLAIDEFQQCVDYSRLAIEGYKVHSGENPLSFAAFQLTFGLRKMKRYPEAVAFIQSIVKQYPPENLATDITYNMTIGNLFADMKQYGKSEQYLLRAYDLNRRQNVNLGLDRDLGHLYIESRQYEKARPYLNRALKDPQANEAYRGYTHYLLYLVDSAAGNYLAAMEHLHRNHTLVDSGLAESKQRDIQKLLIQFEAKEKENKIRIKDQDIALLNQKATLQKAEISRFNLIEQITIGGVLLLSGIVFVLYRSYRAKRRSNRIITQKNDALNSLLAEKEWLLKEVHHRVKNNLHTIICLLESQAYYLENDALKAIENSQHRIYAMSLIHQKMYQSEDIKTMDMANYLPEFVGYLRDSFGNPGHIHFELDIGNIPLGIAQAIPIALIVNEAVTNSIKYAFPDNRPGRIAIGLHRTGEQIRLSVSDNGIGINTGMKDDELHSLGIQLMQGLSRELRGRITFETVGGTRITLIIDPVRLNEHRTFLFPSTEMEVTA